jgi:hypothetical protein
MLAYRLPQDTLLAHPSYPLAGQRILDARDRPRRRLSYLQRAATAPSLTGRWLPKNIRPGTVTEFSSVEAIK